jgi:hypothetical protein
VEIAAESAATAEAIRAQLKVVSLVDAFATGVQGATIGAAR